MFGIFRGLKNNIRSGFRLPAPPPRSFMISQLFRNRLEAPLWAKEPSAYLEFFSFQADSLGGVGEGKGEETVSFISRFCALSIFGVSWEGLWRGLVSLFLRGSLSCM